MAFEVIKTEDGTFKWRLRDEDGAIIKLPRPGKIGLPPVSAEKQQRIDAAWQKSLEAIYDRQSESS